MSTGTEVLRCALAEGELVEALDVRGEAILYGVGGGLRRCDASGARSLPSLPQAQPAFSDVVLSDGESYAVSWPSEGGDARLHALRGETWEAIATASEPRFVLPLRAGLAYADTSNRLRLLRDGEELALSEVALNMPRADAGGERILARRPEDGAVVLSEAVTDGAPQWRVVSDAPGDMPAGFAIDGRPVVAALGVARKDSSVAPVSELIAVSADGTRERIWSGVGSNFAVAGTAVVFVAPDRRGVPEAVVLERLTTASD